MDLGYYVLYLHHGFGNKRIVRLERTINEYLERAQTENEMKTETLAELLKVRYGIDVQKEINLIPMQQLIRIYQRNNPLTINDSTQNAHIKQMRDDRQKAYMETHRDNKAYERFKHMPDYGKGVSDNDK